MDSLAFASKACIKASNSCHKEDNYTKFSPDPPIAINQHVIALTPNTKTVLPQYLAIALNNKDVNSNILRASTGVAIPSITIENLKDIQIPVPDLVTQQKIIDSVNEIQDKLAILEETKSELEKKLASIINCLDLEEV